MCGIAGAISERPIDPCAVIAMRDQLVHRGPDDQGLWLAEDRRVCLGFRRLAIVDLSSEANQPFISADGRYVIVFNGEIYNFKSLRRDLEADGVTFRTQSDTEVLVESFRRWGESCVGRLSGMFAFAVWDSVDRRLFCARDRMGEKPFYYAQLGHDFLFASELKSLLVWPGMRRSIHFPSMVDFLTLGFVADPKCIWENCRKLAPGHSMWVDWSRGAGPRPHAPSAYWDMQFDPDYSVADWGPAVLQSLQAASREMSFADVPVGAFLSGGVDSSSVVAALSRGGCSVNSFTVGFEESGYDERPYAREVSSMYGTNHSERVVEPRDLESVAGKLVWHFDEPFNDYSYVPTFYVCKVAREAITVALSGDGGDELFAGYRKYQRLGLRDDLSRLLPATMRHAIRWASTGLPESSDFRAKLFYHTSSMVDLFTHAFTGAFTHADLRRIARGELAQCLDEYSPSEVVRSLLRHAPPEEVGLLNTMRYLDLKLTLAGGILVKVDRASMATSLEVRPVFLHRDVVAMAGRIPPRLLATRHEAKQALKSAVRPWLPESIITRSKMGFAMPLNKWIGASQESLIGSLVDDPVTDDWLDGRFLKKLVVAHTEGKADHAAHIHSLWFLKRWSSLWLDGQSHAPRAMPTAATSSA